MIPRNLDQTVIVLVWHDIVRSLPGSPVVETGYFRVGPVFGVSAQKQR